jgi:hypothetical protein
MPDRVRLDGGAGPDSRLRDRDHVPPAATVAVGGEVVPFYVCHVWPFTGEVPANGDRYRAAQALAALEIELTALKCADPGGQSFAVALSLVKARLERHFFEPHQPTLEEWDLAT